MIKPGEYKTVGDLKAYVTEVNGKGEAIGWAVLDPADTAACAWNDDGTVLTGDAEYDLDLPRTITIPETELPEPMREAPKHGATFHYYDPIQNKVSREKWEDCRQDKRLLASGLCHCTREAAEQWAEWWKRITGGSE